VESRKNRYFALAWGYRIIFRTVLLYTEAFPKLQIGENRYLYNIEAHFYGGN
jgi:hypothetical protein